MSKLTHEVKVKEVGVDEDQLCIELFSGLRLTGPLRTNPIRREPVAVAVADATPNLPDTVPAG